MIFGTSGTTGASKGAARANRKVATTLVRGLTT